MKIKRFNQLNENGEPETQLYVKIIFEGENTAPLDAIRETDGYHRQFIKKNFTATDLDTLDSAIFYGIEDYIYNFGVGGYSYKIVDVNDNEVSLDKIAETEEMLKNMKKYNI